MKPLYPIAWRRRAEERKQALNANVRVQVNADGWFSGFGPLDRGLMDEGAINLELTKPAPTAEQRASALELAGCFARYIHRGSVIDGASALANRLVETEEYEIAAVLILRAALISSDAPLESWTDLIKLADAVATWLKTGEISACFSVQQQTPVSPLDAGVTLGDLVRVATVLVDADGWVSGLGQRAAGPQQSRS